MRLYHILLIGAFGWAAGSVDEATEPVVETTLGRIRGSTITSASGRSFMAFRGVPYAEPPLRFKDPVAVQPWADVFDATRQGPSCMQYEWITKKIIGTEDCLALNVYTHQLTPPGGLRAVMVWIHGGGFNVGSGNGETDFYGPKMLMDRDIVLVTINYRLGPLGFFTTNSKEAAGNYGLLDQTLALKWIQEHISSFGGDPNSVTIFGGSAGGASVDYHILSPQSKGLFHRAISQSGTSFCPWAMSPLVGKHSYEMAMKLDCLGKSAEDALECLRTKKAEELVPIPEDPRWYDIEFGPRIDRERDSPFLPVSPTELLLSGSFNQVPVIYGVNENEGFVFIGATGVLGDANLMKDFDENPIEYLVHILAINDHRENHEIAKRAVEHYLNQSLPMSEQMPELEKMVSDFTFFGGVQGTINLHNAFNSEPNYAYFYTHRAKISTLQMLGAPPELEGVCHFDEVLLMFSTDVMPPPSSTEDLRMSQILVDLWTSFAIGGEPKTDVVPEWPRNSGKEPRYLNINIEPTVVNGEMPFQQRLAFWNELFQNLYSKKDEL